PRATARTAPGDLPSLEGHALRSLLRLVVPNDAGHARDLPRAFVGDPERALAFLVRRPRQLLAAQTKPPGEIAREDPEERSARRADEHGPEPVDEHVLAGDGERVPPIRIRAALSRLDDRKWLLHKLVRRQARDPLDGDAPPVATGAILRGS